ncbi:hypothetical protein [Mesorhizobium sp. M7A.F.Ce.TU.012.03.2.1]|nr:hypothetical protein [Mesorhizobium sp. M7A.F.Ce.TU.012.03.2.1]
MRYAQAGIDMKRQALEQSLPRRDVIGKRSDDHRFDGWMFGWLHRL